MWYINFVKTYPILSAIIQFAILGTLGEIISKWIINKKVSLAFTPLHILWKMIEWGILAVCIKYAFIGFTSFVEGLAAHNYLPELNLFTKAFAISAFMNLQFGLFLVIAHRLLDNVYTRKINFTNIDKSMLSLLWFWIPAHTITFMLPKDFQIGLAALWSVMLGIILGYFNQSKKK
ncbi:MAG TPA: hypothetical protein VFF33_12940 [Ignavibacteriaceae bacterium]|nr:hypothetical protein [Ignavibacteriaceae bacterium]